MSVRMVPHAPPNSAADTSVLREIPDDSSTAAQTTSVFPDSVITTTTKHGSDVHEALQNESITKQSTKPSQAPTSTEDATHNLPPKAFTHALDVMSDVLTEGMKGVFIDDVEQLPRHFKKYDARVSHPTQRELQVIPRRVLVAGVDAPGDGSWRLKLAAAWTTSGLQVLRPLWPKPVVNLQQRLVRLVCHQKPTVFEYDTNVRKLAGARGYGADVFRLIQRKLNFTDVILPVEGFGSVTSNGSWNGMVGVLSRRVSMSV
ncbi:uncharacterized protein [Panulirus ornatus]|uniref:uncharacterized protein n=1 Tax=Panulirus ornatus TaxID=150431 RepID=UPI003A8426B5